ncbi:MAG: anthranilate phosphoribosyltransferase [Firmicutes bacterium]|nr:anthranilate phosphoribosyltransferase [Bacillota bacterium]
MSIAEAISLLVQGQDLTEEQASAAMDAVMSGQATPAQVAGFLIALRMKGETVAEITGCAKSMRRCAVQIRPRRAPLVDIVGTGGDGSNTFNISTAAALVAAGAGAIVAKHGNRAVSSRCGSADVLEALGIRLDLSPEQVRDCIEETGIGFMFAPLYHQAMKHAAGPRRELGVRTVFNVLGPLTNPAGAQAYVLGAYDAKLVPVLAGVLRALGATHAYVVHGAPGMDELSVCGTTTLAEVTGDRVSEFVLAPEEVGLARSRPEELSGGTAEENARRIVAILRGEDRGPARNAVVLNAGAALKVAGLASSLLDGIAMAQESIDSGAAYRKLEDWRRFTRGQAA